MISSRIAAGPRLTRSLSMRRRHRRRGAPVEVAMTGEAQGDGSGATLRSAGAGGPVLGRR
jgi:hypothetical protein